MTQPVQPRPQPVLDAAKLGGLVSAAVVAVGGLTLVIVHGISTDTLPTLATASGAVATALSALFVYVWTVGKGKEAATQVTPLVDPQAYGGQQLLTADQWINRYGKHAKQPDPPAVQQEWDEKSLAELKAPRPTPYPRELPAVTEPAPVVTLEPDPAPVVEPEPVVEPRVPANMVIWAQHVLTLKGQSKANIAVAQEILGLAGQ